MISVNNIVFEKLSVLPRCFFSVPSRIPAVVSKQCAFTLSFSLSLIMQKSMDMSVLPECWKSTTVIAIHKKDNKRSPENYRQISLTPIEVKVIERVIVDLIMLFLLHHKCVYVSNP